MAPTEWLIARMLERASARARVESPRAAELLAALTGHRLAIRVLGTPWAERPLTLESDGSALLLVVDERPAPEAVGTAVSVGAEPAAAASGASAAASRRNAEAIISGAPLSLLALAGTDPEAPIRRGDVRIEGDGQLAQRYRELALLLVPDFEASLAPLMGHSAAHLAARGVRNAAELARSAARKSLQNVAEFLAHESGDLVSRHEAEHVLRAVDELREQLDRLEARLAELERRAASLAGAAGQS